MTPSQAPSGPAASGVSSPTPAAGADLRARIASLRHELTLTNQSYQSARRDRHVEEVVRLLRKRSRVLQQLFDAQRDLIVQLRTEITADSDSPGPSAT